MKNNNFKDLIAYEIYPTSFFDSNNDGIGDLKGITKKLTYIKNLGFNAIWLNPFYLSPFKDGGYDVKDFKKIDPKFGTMGDFKKLLNNAHSLGIKIILDLVAGHLSEESFEFLESAKEKRNKYSDMFIWTNDIWDWTNEFRIIGGKFPRNGSYVVNFFATQPALNFGFYNITQPSWQMSYKDERTKIAKNFLIDVMDFYLSMGVDGFRVDMADSLVKNDPEKIGTIEVWNEMFKIIKTKYPNSYFVSEWSNPELSFKAGFDADFVLDHRGNFYSLLAKNGVDNNKCVLKGGDYTKFVEDLSYRMGIAKRSNSNLAIISGNHDTMRIASSLNSKQLKAYYIFMLTMPGNPFIYYGDELEMTHANISTKDGGYNRTGDRTPMQWNNGKNKGFSRSDNIYLPIKNDKKSVKNSTISKKSLFYLIKDLIEFRKINSDTINSEFKLDDEKGVLKFDRGSYLTILNLSKETIKINNCIFCSGNSKKYLKPLECAIIKK